ncbi:MAG: MATE family efflux transporter [Succinivibrio sp.]|nr:MATE family efflux transporter [Succinivibrio sp.]
MLFNAEQRSEARRLLRLFWPIILGQLAQTSINLVDTMMSGLAGTLQLSGVAVGASLVIPFEFFIIGLSLAVQPVVAQLRGGGRLSQVPPYLCAATALSLAISLLSGLLLTQVDLIFPYLGTEQDMLKVAYGYALAIAAALPALCLFNLMRALCEGLGSTVPTLIFGFTALILNIPLNYIFIFGAGPVPALGGIGCGIATALTWYLCVILFYFYLRHALLLAPLRQCWSGFATTVTQIREFLHLALPFGISSCLEVTCFGLAALILAPFGEIVVSAHAITLNVSSLYFMIPMSLGAAVTICVGEYQGARSQRRCLNLIAASFKVQLLFYLGCMSSLVLLRYHIAALYSADEEVVVLAGNLMLLCAMYMLPDCIQMNGIGVARGFKDSRTIMLVTALSYWVIALPAGFVLARGMFGLPQYAASGIWYGFIGGLSCAALCYIIRVLRLSRNLSCEL